MKELDLKQILENTKELKKKRVWYVSILGRPNVWKSTFINTLIWEKISITTNVPQTTRRKVLAIYNDNDSQIIFFDTPWIHKSEKKFNEQLNLQATSSIKDSDLLLYFIDSSRKSWEEEVYIKQILENINIPVFKVYTKIDINSRNDIIEDKNIFKISSVNNHGFDRLLSSIKLNLKEDITLFPDDIYTKQDIYFRISEIIREKVFLHTKEEIPHSIFVWVEEVEDIIISKEITENEKKKKHSKKVKDMLKIMAYIYSETDSQKYILIWKSWKIISSIWKEARLELEKIFDKKVFLNLRVKVRKNWRKDEALLKKILN